MLSMIPPSLRVSHLQGSCNTLQYAAGGCRPRSANDLQMRGQRRWSGTSAAERKSIIFQGLTSGGPGTKPRTHIVL
jgi:hypothetical protein